MYQQMQESLHANLADSSLPPHMHRAVKKGLAKLGHYYSLTKLNHFNIIAAGKHLQISLLKTFLMIMESTVCHPALCLSWFRSLDKDSYNHAKEVFEYHLQEYQATTLEPTTIWIWLASRIQFISSEHCSLLIVIAPCHSCSVTTVMTDVFQKMNFKCQGN